MSSLEKERKKLDAAIIKFSSSKSARMPNNLGERTAGLAAMMFASGYTLTESVNVSAMQEKVEKKISKEFLKFINTLAMSTPKSFWHVYEPNKVGITSARLFDLKSSDKVFKSVMRMELTFKPSKMMTPVPEELKQPGPTGKFVKRRHKFPNKALTYEYGTTIHVRVKKAKYLAFLSNKPAKASRRLPSGNYINFYKSITIDTKSQPTYQSLSRTAKDFMDERAPRIAQDVYEKQAKYMREAGIMAVRKSITVKTPSNSAAKSMGKKIAKGFARQ